MHVKLTNERTRHNCARLADLDLPAWISVTELLFARFTYNTVNTFTPPNFGIVNGFEISGGRFNFDGPASDVTQQRVLGYTHIFSPALLLDLRAAFTRINNLSLPLNYHCGSD